MNRTQETLRLMYWFLLLATYGTVLWLLPTLAFHSPWPSLVTPAGILDLYLMIWGSLWVRDQMENKP